MTSRYECILVPIPGPEPTSYPKSGSSGPKIEEGKNMKVADAYERPFPDAELTEDDFIAIEELIGKEIEITDTKEYENDKGPGIYILFKIGKDVGYTATHSINIIAILTKPKIVEALENGDTLECTVQKRPSKKDKSKTVYTLI